jgi:hypothetical protein
VCVGQCMAQSGKDWVNPAGHFVICAAHVLLLQHGVAKVAAARLLLLGGGFCSISQSLRCNHILDKARRNRSPCCSALQIRCRQRQVMGLPLWLQGAPRPQASGKVKYTHAGQFYGFARGNFLTSGGVSGCKQKESLGFAQEPCQRAPRPRPLSKRGPPYGGPMPFLQSEDIPLGIHKGAYTKGVPYLVAALLTCIPVVHVLSVMAPGRAMPRQRRHARGCNVQLAATACSSWFCLVLYMLCAWLSAAT